MTKKKTKKRIQIGVKQLSVALGAIILIAGFLYLKIIYFPGRTADINDIPLPMIISDGDIANARKIDIESLRSFTGDYIVSANTVESLERFYKSTQDEKVALSLVQMYILHYQFDKAFELVKDIYNNDIDFSLVPSTTFLYVLFNSSELSPSNYAVIQGILDDYKKNASIDNETYTLYNGLLAVYKDDTKTFYESINALSGSKQFETLVKAIGNAKSAGQNVGSSVPYYSDALAAVVLLQEGYFRVAQKRAVSIRQKDAKYVLPYQVLAQAALLQSHWQEAVQYFDTLLKLDTSNADQYHFGLCTAYFRQKSYENAVLHCKQVKNKNTVADATRYVLLSYYQKKDRQGIMETFQLMLNKQKPSENDYFTFFDVVFYQPFVTDKDFSHVQKYYVSVVLPYLDSCVKEFGATHNACRYGQVGFYLYKNDFKKARKELLYLAVRHPSNYILRVLGEYYESQGEEDKAKAYYLKAMTVTTGAVIDISSAKSGAGNSLMNK